jgi:hypothetical protein
VSWQQDTSRTGVGVEWSGFSFPEFGRSRVEKMVLAGRIDPLL